MNEDPTRLEVILNGVAGGRLRLTVWAKKLGAGYFGPNSFADDRGNPDYLPITNKLSSLVQETVFPKQPDVSFDMDLITMGRSKI